ncbi:kinesin-like protein KIFC1 [Lonchura striata]
MASRPEADAAELPGPSSRLPRLPAAQARQKRALSAGPPAGPPQQKRSRTGLGPGGARAAPKAPLRTGGPAAAGKNDDRRKAASVPAAPQAGSATSTAGAKGPSKRPPWDLRGQIRDLQEALEQGRERLQLLEREKQEQSQHLEQLQRELGQRKSQESSLCSRVSSLEEELSQVREKLEQSQKKAKSLEAEEERLKAQEEQRRQERDEARDRAQALLQQLENAQAQLQELQAQLQELQALRELEESQRILLAQREQHIHLLEMERRRLHNDILELRGNIRVFCRVRPLLPEERERQRGLPHLHFPPQDTRSLVLTRPDDSQLGRERRAELRYDFTFDRVFPPAASQEEIFQEIQLLVQSALDGYPVCIFAYGQTGSGKTFTMEGPAPAGAPASRGMIPRAVRHLFRGARDLAAKGWQYGFSASFLEIYNENLRDLLLAPGQRGSELEIRRLAPGSDELHVPNLTWVPVESEEQVLQLLQRAGSQRSVARTALNERSSRSHSVFQLRIQGLHAARDLRCSSSLTLVDLAGSERLEKSGSVGTRLRETQSINSSLSALGLVISALCNKEQHIPYRNSKLTFLLQNCLGGHAKVLMIVTISPVEENFGESLNSLRFASKGVFGVNFGCFWGCFWGYF